MQPLGCDAPGCSTPASFRQMEPIDDKAPVYLCAYHWNRQRIMSAERAAMYGSLKVLGPLTSDLDSDP